MRKPVLPFLVLSACAAASARGAAYYDETARCIRVVDFPRYAPCTPATLRRMDRLYGWGKVRYDARTDTYTIAADLFIGSDDGSETYFQVGSAAHPRETLVMRGELVVCPYWIEGRSAYAAHWRAPRRVNRLTIGVAGDASVRAALKFDDPQHKGYTLRLGAWRDASGKWRRGYGGQLHVYRGVITSASPRPGGEFGCRRGAVGMFLTGDEVVLDHAVLSWVRGAATYGLPSTARVRDTVFEHCGAGLINGRHDLRRCTFRHCRIAVRDYGSIDAVLTECVFEQNQQNWTLVFSDKGVTCIDCVIGKPRRPDAYRCWRNRRTGKMQYPSFLSKRHIVVEAVDEKGRPVRGASVRVVADPAAADWCENLVQKTDARGRTPGRGDPKAILLADARKQATEKENQPRTLLFRYTIQAAAPGFRPAEVKGFRPEKSWQVVRVTLRR